ncbi:hypothetical protein B296_00054147, partial [Ensete ventricosum]
TLACDGSFACDGKSEPSWPRTGKPYRTAHRKIPSLPRVSVEIKKNPSGKYPPFISTATVLRRRRPGSARVRPPLCPHNMMRRGLGFGLASLLRPGRFAATPLGRKVGALSFLFRRSISSTGGDVSARCCYRGQRGFCGYAVEQFSDDEYECEFGSHKDSPEGVKMLNFRNSLPAYKEKDRLLSAIARNQFSTNQLALRARDSLASWTPDCIGFNLIEAVLCHICRKERPGAALVFMTGWDDISCLRDQLRAHPLLGDPNRVLVLTCHGSMATSEQVSLAMFAISTFTARYGQYMLVRQVAGTWTARYRAVPPKIDRRRLIEGRNRPSTVD